MHICVGGCVHYTMFDNDKTILFRGNRRNPMQTLPPPPKEKEVRVLVACEFSGIVRDAFIARGHDAISCDLLPTERPGPHIQGDVVHLLQAGREFDLMIAFPPCTHLACSGARHFKQKKADGRQQEGRDFFMIFTKTNIPKWAIENPVGIMSKQYRIPDQIIQPYYFGDEFQKSTCLWLNRLPPLQHFSEDDFFGKKTHTGKGEMVVFKSGCKMPKWYADASGDSHLRSKTFPGIAKAMAEQWG